MSWPKKWESRARTLSLVLEKMGIKGKTPSSGLDDKETKSLIEKLKAIRKEKEKEKIKKETAAADPLASREERMKKAAALIGKFSSTLEKPGAKPKPARSSPRRRNRRCLRLPSFRLRDRLNLPPVAL